MPLFEPPFLAQLLEELTNRNTERLGELVPNIHS